MDQVLVKQFSPLYGAFDKSIEAQFCTDNSDNLPSLVSRVEGTLTGISTLVKSAEELRLHKVGRPADVAVWASLKDPICNTCQILSRHIDSLFHQSNIEMARVVEADDFLNPAGPLKRVGSENDFRNLFNYLEKELIGSKSAAEFGRLRTNFLSVRRDFLVAEITNRQVGGHV